jgi:hypothetical protein
VVVPTIGLVSVNERAVCVKWFESSALGLIVGLLASGCEAENPGTGEKRADAAVSDAADPELVAGITAEQLTGDYLFVVSIKVLPKAPVVFLAQISAERVDDLLVLKLRHKALDKTDRVTPVSWWGPWQTGTIDAEGRFESETIAARIPAESNSISGQDADAEIMLHGLLSDSVDVGTLDGAVEFVCGTVTGQILRPIPIDSLTGSTFTATRIPDVDDPSTYPEVVINCDRDPARPLQ